MLKLVLLKLHSVLLIHLFCTVYDPFQDLHSGVARAFQVGEPPTLKTKMREKMKKIQETKEKLRKCSYLAHPRRDWLRPWTYSKSFKTNWAHSSFFIWTFKLVAKLGVVAPREKSATILPFPVTAIMGFIIDEHQYYLASANKGVCLTFDVPLWAAICISNLHN